MGGAAKAFVSPSAVNFAAVSWMVLSKRTSVSFDTRPSASRRSICSWFRLLLTMSCTVRMGHRQDPQLFGRGLGLVRPVPGDDAIDEERGNDHQEGDGNLADLALLDANDVDPGQFEHVDRKEH